jgi:quercetin dioxygenase-like cupin family protein
MISEARKGDGMPTILRIYSGDDGQSHIEEVSLEMQPFVDTEGAHGEGTPLQHTAGVTFRLSPPGYVLSWHCAPRRQYTITLAGEAEVEVGDGTIKRIGPGDVLLAEDLTGQGHITRVVGDQQRFYAVIPLEEASA